MPCISLHVVNPPIAGEASGPQIIVINAPLPGSSDYVAQPPLTPSFRLTDTQAIVESTSEAAFL